MRHCPQTIDQVGNLLIRQQKRVTSRDQDVPNFRVHGDPRQALVNVEVEFQITINDQFLAKAVSTIDSAVLVDCEGDPVFVLPGNGIWTVFVIVPIFFPDQIVVDPKDILLFFAGGNHLLADRAVRVFMIHQ